MKPLAYLKSFGQAAVIFILVSLAADYWRKPTPPQTTLPTATTVNGQTVDLDALSRNQTAVVYFWAEWCEVCRYTSPAIDKLHRSGIPVVGIALQSGSNRAIKDYLHRHALGFDSINDSDGLLSAHWHIRATPTIVFIRNGRMIHHTVGFSSYVGLKSRLWLSALF